jgi:hypothetical protein
MASHKLERDDPAYLKAAYRLAGIARNIADDLPLLVGASAEAYDTAAVRLLQMAINVAEGREPREERPHGKSPGPPPRDWVALTGHSLEKLIYLVRLRRIEIAKTKRENPDAVLPHSGGLEVTCDEILKKLLILKPKPGAAFTEFAEPLARIITAQDCLLPAEGHYSDWVDEAGQPLTFGIARDGVEEVGWIGREAGRKDEKRKTRKSAREGSR